MATHEMTLDDLKRILNQAAGEADGLALSGATADLTFDELGYDSLALLETGSRIQRERGISLDDSTITNSQTPRDLLNAVNEVEPAEPGA